MARNFNSSGNLYNGNPPLTDMPISMSCLFYATNNNESQGLISILEDGGDQWYIMYLSNERIKAYSRNGGTTPIATSSPTNIQKDTWYQATAVFAASNSRSAYLNGADKVTDTNSCSPDSGQINQVSIGKQFANFTGQLAELGIWNIALTDVEIETLGKFISPLLVRPQNLVFYLPAIRDNDEDLIGGLSMTVGGTPVVSPHPRVFYIAPVDYVGKLFVPDRIQTTFNLPNSIRAQSIEYQKQITQADRKHYDTSKGKL